MHYSYLQSFSYREVRAVEARHLAGQDPCNPMQYTRAEDLKDEPRFRKGVGITLIVIAILGAAAGAYYLKNNPLPKLGLIGSECLVGGVALGMTALGAYLIYSHDHKKLSERDAEQFGPVGIQGAKIELRGIHESRAKLDATPSLLERLKGCRLFKKA